VEPVAIQIEDEYDDDEVDIAAVIISISYS
jgi:hypothetical protein